ncbi:MAG: hypothetical protein U5L96_01755 [Owenweeksia sp.]|nr:hypothetical protein [Owenweeksia sp.]
MNPLWWTGLRSATRTTAESITNMAVRDINSVSAQVAGVSAAEFKISQNPVTLKFKVETPYEIPSDGVEYKVAITSYERPGNLPLSSGTKAR